MMRGEWAAAAETLRLAADKKDGWGWGVNNGDIWIAEAAARLVHGAELSTRGGADDADAAARQLDEAATSIAITAPSGIGSARVLLELQQLWLLGYSERIVTTPGSQLGIVGHSRTRLAPVVVVDETSHHQSTATTPCMVSVGLIQHATCFTPGMLARVSYDPLTPC